jgi:hypothetical protein
MGGHGLWLLAAQTGWMFRVAVMDRGQWRAGKKGNAFRYGRSPQMIDHCFR